MERMSGAGAQLVTVFALGAELQADWKRETATDAGVVFNKHLPEYGFVNARASAMVVSKSQR